MKKISDYRDEEALDLLADLIEPAAEIMGDAAFSEAARNNRMAEAVKLAIKGHKRAVLEVLARIDGVPVQEFHCNVVTLPMRLLDLFNDPEIMQVFTSPEAENAPSGISGSVTETTADAGE